MPTQPKSNTYSFELPSTYRFGTASPEMFQDADVMIDVGAPHRWSAFDYLATPPREQWIVRRVYHTSYHCTDIYRHFVDTYGPPTGIGHLGYGWDGVSFILHYRPQEKQPRGLWGNCGFGVEAWGPDMPPFAMLFDAGDVHWYRPRVAEERRTAFSIAWADAVQRFLTDQPATRYEGLTDEDHDEIAASLLSLKLPFAAPEQWIELPPDRGGRISAPRRPLQGWKTRYGRVPERPPKTTE